MPFFTVLAGLWWPWSHGRSVNSPTEVPLGRRQGLPVPCVVNLDNILTVPRQRLIRLMGACDVRKMEELNQAVKAALDIP